jgi:hypothetical protein
MRWHNGGGTGEESPESWYKFYQEINQAPRLSLEILWQRDNLESTTRNTKAIRAKRKKQIGKFVLIRN